MKLTHIYFSAGILFMAACNQPDKKITDTPVTPDSVVSAVKKDTAVAYSEFNVDTIHSAKEKKILEKITQLPEFKRSNAYIDSLTNHKHGLALMIFEPEKGEKYYYVKAGFNGSDRFETYYNFYVDSAKLTIKIADALDGGDIIPIEEWRKKEKPKENSILL
jgi:hypothetical protein